MFTFVISSVPMRSAGGNVYLGPTFRPFRRLQRHAFHHRVAMSKALLALVHQLQVAATSLHAVGTGDISKAPPLISISSLQTGGINRLYKKVRYTECETFPLALSRMRRSIAWFSTLTSSVIVWRSGARSVGLPSLHKFQLIVPLPD